MLAFVVLGLVSSILRQEVSCKEHIQNDLFCVEWDVKLTRCSVLFILALQKHAYVAVCELQWRLLK